MAVRLPAAVVDALELKEGDQIEIRILSGCGEVGERAAGDAVGREVRGIRGSSASRPSARWQLAKKARGSAVGGGALSGSVAVSATSAHDVGSILLRLPA